MDFFKTVTGNVTKAVDYVVEKNRKAALINRIRVVIKNERENEARAYIALGKYYFEKLRDPQTEETERLCKAVESSEQRMRKAFTKLDEITAPEGCDEDSCSDCSDDCDYCPYYDESEEKEETPAPHTETYADDFPPSFSIVDKANETAGAANEEAADDDAPPAYGIIDMDKEVVIHPDEEDAENTAANPEI
jgi:hypothetical protein